MTARPQDGRDTSRPRRKTEEQRKQTERERKRRRIDRIKADPVAQAALSARRREYWAKYMAELKADPVAYAAYLAKKREREIRWYHEVIKLDPEKLKRHRETSRRREKLFRLEIVPMKIMQVEGIGKIKAYLNKAHFLGVVWPLIGEDTKEIAWRLRYGKPSKADLKAASEIVSAYVTLVERSNARGFETIRKALLAVEDEACKNVLADGE